MRFRLRPALRSTPGSRAVLVAPDIDCARILPGYDFADAYAIPAPADIDLVRATALAFARGPRWIKALLSLRNRLGTWAGLKPASPGGFPIIRQTPTEVLMGFDDRHLDFRIVVTANSGLVVLTTVVRCRNFWGRTYLRAVMPFHRAIAPRMLEGIA
jgi:hypothetical protein